MSDSMEQQTSQLPANTHRRLLETSGKVTAFLSNLTTDVTLPDGTVVKAAMPVSAFRNIKGLAVSMRRKWGALGTYTHEMAFITRKLITPDGAIAWSPPFFFVGRLFGAGITIGSMHAGNAYALMNDEAFASFSRPHPSYSINADFLVDMNGSKIRRIAMDSTTQDACVTTDVSGGMMAKYFRLDALMLDWSCSFGSFRPNRGFNRTIYGNVPMEDVLSGKLPCPTEFRSVMDALKRYTDSAMEVDPRKLGHSRSRGGSAHGSAMLLPGSRAGGATSGATSGDNSNNSSRREAAADRTSGDW